MKKNIILSVVLCAGLMIGCGGGSNNNDSSSNVNSSSETTNKPTQSVQNLITKNVKVLDNYVIGAVVTDGEHNCTTDKNGSATCKVLANKTLIAKGGNIDVNNNHVVDENDIPLTVTLKSKTNLLTPITTLVVDGLNIDKLSEITGINATDLTSDPYITNNLEVAKVNQLVYVVLLNNKENELIQKVNTFSKTIKQPEDTNKQVLPNLFDDKLYKVQGDLPVIYNDNIEKGVTSSSSFTSSVEVFANIVKEVVGDNSSDLIDEIINFKGNASDLEMDIIDMKKELINNLDNQTESTKEQQTTNTKNQTESTKEQQTTNTKNQTENSALPLL